MSNGDERLNKRYLLRYILKIYKAFYVGQHYSVVGKSWHGERDWSGAINTESRKFSLNSDTEAPDILQSMFIA